MARLEVELTLIDGKVVYRREWNNSICYGDIL